MTGSHTVQLLLKRGHTVRVIAHNEDERSMRLQELGAEETNHDHCCRPGRQAPFCGCAIPKGKTGRCADD